MKDSNNKLISIRIDEDECGEIPDDYGLSLVNMHLKSPQQLITPRILQTSPRSQPMKSGQNKGQQSQQSTLQTPQVLSPEDGKILTLGSEETGKNLSRNGRILGQQSKSTAKANSRHSHSSLFHSKSDLAEDYYASEVAEFPTKENENVPYPNGGFVKRKEAGNNGIFNQEFSLGLLEQGKYNTQQQEQHHNQYIDQDVQNKQRHINQDEKHLQLTETSNQNHHKRLQQSDIEMAMISHEDDVAGEGFNNNDLQMVKGYLYSKNDNNNHLNNMFPSQQLGINQATTEIDKQASQQNQKGQLNLANKTTHFHHKTATQNINKCAPSSVDSNDSTRPLNNEMHESNGKLKNGMVNVGFDTEEIESSEQSIEDKLNNNAMVLKTAPSKRTSKTNVVVQQQLNTINEQLEQHYMEEQTNTVSPLHHHPTELSVHSEVEEKKNVSNYLFCEREIFSSNDWCRSYVTCKNQQLVLIKVLDRRKVYEKTQQLMKNEFKLIIQNQLKSAQVDTNPREGYINPSNEHYYLDYIEEQQQEFKKNQLTYAVSLVDFFWTKQYIYIVQEYLHQQSLYSMLLHTSKMKVSDSIAVHLLSKIVEALDEVTNTPHVNFNLKITNVFFDGQNIKFNDFQESYLTAKQEIIQANKTNNNNNNSNNPKSKNIFGQLKRTHIVFNPNVKQLGLIYLQLICGIEAITQSTLDSQSFQKYLHSQGVLRQVSDFLLKCIYIETATLGDVRAYLQKSLHRNKKANANSSPIGFRNLIGSGNSYYNSNNRRRTSEAFLFGGIKNNLQNKSSSGQFSQIQYEQQQAQFSGQIQQKSTYNNNNLQLQQQQLFQSPGGMLSSIPVSHQKKKSTISIDLNNDPDEDNNKYDQRNPGESLFELFDNASQHEKGKIKETTFLKCYSYKQGMMSFDLKIIHLKLTTYQIKEESVTNSQEFETNHRIPIFTVPQESQFQGRRKTIGASLNYNPKYSWEFLQEIDNLPYFDLPEEHLDINKLNGQVEQLDDPTRYLLEGYSRLMRQRFHMMRCHDKNSKKNYTLKCIRIEDDQEFADVLREIAIYKYIDQNLHQGITILKKTKGESEIQSCMEADYEALPEVAHRVAGDYLEELYKQADKEVLKQLEGGIHRCIDSYIINRGANGMTFVIVLEDVNFSMKDFLIKNSQVEKNPESLQSQVVSLVRVITKQIKRLKRIGIYHSNIAPENIFISQSQNSKDIYSSKIYLSNFETALIGKPEQLRSEFSSAFAKIQGQSYKYKAPEFRRIIETYQIDKDQVDFDPVKNDIFSLGVCALELHLHQIISDGVLANTIEDIEQDTVCGDLILGMMDFNETERFSENDIFKYLKEQTSFHRQYNLSQPSSPMLPTGRAQTSTRISTRNNQQQSKFRRSTTVKLAPSFQLQALFNKNNIHNNNNHSMDNISHQDIVQISEKEEENQFVYEPISLSTIGEIPGDMQLLYQSKCARKMFLFQESNPILDSLEQKYLRSKQRLGDQQAIEIKLLEELGNYRRDTFHVTTSLDYYQRALSLQQRNFPEEYLTAGKLQLKIAELLLKSDDGSKNSNQISILLKSAVENYKEVYHNTSPKIVPILITIGDELAQKGFVVDALHQYQESMIITNPLGYSGPHGIHLLDKLGWAFFQSSDYQNALKFFMKSVSVKEKVLAGKNLVLAESYNNLGECYRILNEPTKAIYYYEAALTVTQLDKETFQKSKQNQLQLKGNEDIQSESQFGLLSLNAQVYNNLGLIYKTNQKFSKAIKLFKESLEIRIQQFGQSSLEAAECQYNIAVIYAEQNKHTEAMELYDQIIQQFKVSKELDNMIYADCLQNKGISLYQINDFAKALSLLNESITIKRKKNPNSLSVAISTMNLALVYHKQGQYKKALQLYEDSLRIFVKKLKQDHPYIAIIQENMKQTQRFAR